jgi:hypothetical protein
MNETCGNKKVIQNGLQDLNSRLGGNPADVRAHVAAVTQNEDPAALDAHMTALSARVGTALQQASEEPDHQDLHYVSRFDSVGLFQSVLSKVFNDIPGLQGYGNANPVWVTTLIEGLFHEIKAFFDKVYQDTHGGQQPLWKSLVTELLQLPAMDFRAPFPQGIPDPHNLPENVPIALLADWGGDNPAARLIAQVAIRQKPAIGIHLGDVYYGGTKEECETFLDLWPLRNAAGQFPAGTSWALNGNHEMYCGGQYYFDVILKAFGQPQSFFCLQNDYWRLIGLDSAYKGGTLKPTSANDPVSTQWNWLTQLLKDGSGRKNILLTHHQPVSAHRPEFDASQQLYAEVNELLASEGVPPDAIFGWFFGHEHRCAVYDDRATPYNARLIGNGCIPHLVQTEIAADPGCTPVTFFNKLGENNAPSAAVSSFAVLRFGGPELTIDYINENFRTFGSELWSATKGRLNGVPFIEYDGRTQSAAGASPAGVPQANE